MPQGRRGVLRLIALGGAAGLLAACGFPRDPDGTLDRARGGVLRVGVTENPPWTTWPDGMPGDGEEAEPGGTEVELVRGFAGTIDAEVGWVAGSEADLLEQLERGELDVVVGGLLTTTPWADRVALTLVYATTSDEGERQQHVMAVPPGENDLQVTLESYLLDEAAS